MTTRKLTVIDALQDRALFGGLPMGDDDRELFSRCTGRGKRRRGSYAEGAVQ